MARKANPPEFYLTFVDREYLAHIGQVVVQWSLLESLIESSIWRASKVPLHIGQSMTSQTQMLGKLDILGSVLHETNPPLAEAFRPVADYIRDCLSGKRNLVVHGLWAKFSETHRLVVKTAARGRIVSHSRLVSDAEIQDLARDIAEVTDWVSLLNDRLPGWRKLSDELGPVFN